MVYLHVTLISNLLLILAIIVVAYAIVQQHNHNIISYIQLWSRNTKAVAQR